MKPAPPNNDNQRQGSPPRSTGKVRKVERLSIPVRQTFDQQFWPVLIALVIFSGIAAGAIVTLMAGTRMWIALLALPAVTAALMYLLYRMDQSRIGRTFQFAILVTFAFHLLLLIFASFIILFNNPYEAPQRQIAQKQQNTLIISRQQQPHVWQQSQKRSVANPNVEVQRQQSQTATRSQTIPVENSQPTPTPQTVRRESRESTVPRLDRELSQLRRSRSNAKPKSSVASMSSASSAKSKPTRETRLQKTESAAASKVQRRSAAAPASRTDSQVEATSASSPAPSPSKRREREIAAAPAPAAESKATIRRRSAQVPSSTTAKIAEASSSKPTKSKSRDAEPTAESKADKIARKSSTSSAEKQVTTTETTSRRSDVAKSQRRESPVSQQTLSKPNVDSPQPRKSTRQSDIASTVAQIDAPANPQSAKASRPQPSPQALAVSKSERGTAGAGRSPNLESAVGGQRSPAHVASDSSRDQRRENTLANNISLSSQQQAEAGRSTARSLKPTSSFKAETADMAKIAGSSLPSLKSESSSAANIDSAAKIDRSKTIAEKGQSSLDLGPTKILNDQIAQRRGGGGMPQIAPAAPAKQASGRSKSQQVPSQIAAASVETKGPLDPSSMPATSGAQVNDDVDEVARSQPSESSRPQAAPNTGVESEFEARMADSKSERASDAVGEIQSLEPATEESQTGNKRTRIARAPRRSNTDANFGLQDPKSGVSPSESLRPREGNSIAAELIDRASNAIPGSALAKTATGALAQATTSMPVIDTSGTGRRRAKDTDDLGPANAASAKSTAPAKTNLPRSNGVASVKTNSPKNAGKSIEVSPDAPSDSTGIVRSDSSEAGAELEVQAQVGPAGLLEMPSRTLGVTTRPATKNSPLIAMASDTRFKKRTFGGLPSFSPPAVMAREAFRQRRSAAKAKSAPSTEAAIESGLEFLARFQVSDGSWSLSQFDVDHPMHRTQLNSDTAATGLAMLAFQGAGYNHREFKYADQLQRAADWMVKNQAADGGLYLDADEKSNNSSRMYSHAIAALALTEAYGMTQDPKLRRPAQKAIDYIQSTQDPNRGGWRYFAQPNNMRSTDTSVTGWMMMALQSARLSGLKIDDQTMRGIDSWLNTAAIGESEFSYNPLANDAPGVSRQHGRNASNSMTAVGLLMRIYGGWNRFDPRFQMGAIKLLEQMPSDANAKVRDTYYWYYATQVMKHVGGDAWNQWNSQLQPLLVGSQERIGNMRGSWNPYEPVPDRWGPHGGRLYVTTMNLLSLEVRYRLLPLYDQTINK